MNLFVDAHVFDDLAQGSKTYLRGLYSSVLKENNADKLYFASHNPAIAEKEIGTQSNARYISYSSENKFYRLGFEIPRLISKCKADWAHFQYISPAIKTCSEIVTIHDLLFLEFPEYFPQRYRLVKNFLFKRSVDRAERILTVSEFSKRALERFYGTDPNKVTITPNGVLDYFWDDSPVNATLDNLDQFILCVSRFEPRKNQLGLLQSYLQLELWKKGIQLVFAGGVGIHTEAFSRLLDSLDEKTRRMIVVAGDISLENLKWLYKNCLLFVYPSFAEGFGIPPLEALACGANVICSNTTAMSEFKFLGERLFDPNDAAEMTEKINYFLNNPKAGDLPQMQLYIRKYYSWDHAAHQMLNVLR